jgi:hypothetical protein
MAILAITRVHSISGVTHSMRISYAWNAQGMRTVSRKECAWSHARNAHGFTQHITHSITSHNAYKDAFILAVLWPVRTESIHLRTGAVLSRDLRLTPDAP